MGIEIQNRVLMGLVFAALLVSVPEPSAASVTVSNCASSFESSDASDSCGDPDVSVSGGECVVGARCQRNSGSCSNPDRCTRYSTVTGSRDDIEDLRNCDGVLKVGSC